MLEEYYLLLYGQAAGTVPGMRLKRSKTQRNSALMKGTSQTHSRTLALHLHKRGADVVKLRY